MHVTVIICNKLSRILPYNEWTSRNHWHIVNRVNKPPMIGYLCSNTDVSTSYEINASFMWCRHKPPDVCMPSAPIKPASKENDNLAGAVKNVCRRVKLTATTTLDSHDARLSRFRLTSRCVLSPYAASAFYSQCPHVHAHGKIHFIYML